MVEGFIPVMDGHRAGCWTHMPLPRSGSEGQSLLLTHLHGEAKRSSSARTKMAGSGRDSFCYTIGEMTSITAVAPEFSHLKQ